MKIIDLTHTITEDMPVYPGTEPPRLHPANTVEKDGFKETLLNLYSHTGTHMDAPSHLFAGRTMLEAMPVAQFVAKAVVVDCRDLPPGGSITMERIDAVRERADGAELLLFNTGWDRLWGTDAYFDGYPCMTEEVAQYVAASGKKGVGIDAISVDPIDSSSLPRHRQLLANHDIVIIENLTNLHLIGPGLFTLCALPLKYRDSDGAPVRAIAMVED